MRYRKLGRRSDHRRAMLRNMVTALLREERIETTETRAREVSSLAEKMITLAKRGDLHGKRQVLSFLTEEATANKLFETIAARYETRAGGYTRITKIGPRRGDSAPMAQLELI